MKSFSRILALAGALGIAGIASAADYRLLGINYTLGPSFIAGNSNATDASSVEPGIGTALQLRFTRHVDLNFAYDYVDATLHSQALTFGGTWRFRSDGRWTPFVSGGRGFGKPVRGEGWDHFSLKLTGGLERPLTSDISVAGVMTYHFLDGPVDVSNVHVLWPGIRMIYYFAGLTGR
jgi:hypothetical protein